jgi:hypothetical protein
MKCQSPEQIAPEADVHRGIDMSRRERLERWAQPLERQPNRRMSTIGGTEFGSPRDRQQKHADISPLTVTFEEPVPARCGAPGDRVGDAILRRARLSPA